MTTGSSGFWLGAAPEEPSPAVLEKLESGIDLFMQVSTDDAALDGVPAYISLRLDQDRLNEIVTAAHDVALFGSTDYAHEHREADLRWHFEVTAAGFRFSAWSPECTTVCVTPVIQFTELARVMAGSPSASFSSGAESGCSWFGGALLYADAGLSALAAGVVARHPELGALQTGYDMAARIAGAGPVGWRPSSAGARRRVGV